MEVEISEKCLMKPGDAIGTYTVVEKIGKGGFSTVYHCTGGGVGSGVVSAVAIKAYDIDLEKYYRNEVNVLRRIGSGHDNVISMSGAFAHVHEQTAAIYPCIVMELRGESVFKLLNYCRKEIGGGLPLAMVLAIVRDMFSGLVFLHECGIIHGDIKPDNLLLGCAITEDMTADDIHIKIADVGSSSFTDKIFSPNIGTAGYQAPEIVIGTPFGTSADIWSAFAVCFELIAGASLFDVYFEDDIDYGDVNENSIGMNDVAVYTLCSGCAIGDNGDTTTDLRYASCECGLCDTCSTHEACATSDDTSTGTTESTSETSSSSDDPELKYARNYCYLLLVAKVIGYPPQSFADNARDYYNRKGKLLTNPDVVPTTISQLLDDNYDMDAELCARVEEFLLHGLKYEPGDRITAAAALRHAFLAYQ